MADRDAVMETQEYPYQLSAFYVMPRYGKTLESLLLKMNFRVSKESIYSLGIKLLDALELIH